MQIALPDLNTPATLILDREHRLTDEVYFIASSEEFVGVLGDSARRLAEEPVKLSAGGIEGILLRLGAAAMNQRTTFVIDHITENLSDVFPS